MSSKTTNFKRMYLVSDLAYAKQPTLPHKNTIVSATKNGAVNGITPISSAMEIENVHPRPSPALNNTISKGSVPTNTVQHLDPYHNEEINNVYETREEYLPDTRNYIHFSHDAPFRNNRVIRNIRGDGIRVAPSEIDDDDDEDHSSIDEDNDLPAISLATPVTTNRRTYEPYFSDDYESSKEEEDRDDQNRQHVVKVKTISEPVTMMTDMKKIKTGQKKTKHHALTYGPPEPNPPPTSIMHGPMHVMSKQHYKKPKKEHIKGKFKPQTTRNLLNKFKQRQKPKQVKRKNNTKNRCKICEIDFLDERTLKKHISDSHHMPMRKPKRKLEADAKQSIAKYSRIN